MNNYQFDPLNSAPIAGVEKVLIETETSGLKNFINSQLSKISDKEAIVAADKEFGRGMSNKTKDISIAHQTNNTAILRHSNKPTRAITRTQAKEKTEIMSKNPPQLDNMSIVSGSPGDNTFTGKLKLLVNVNSKVDLTPATKIRVQSIFNGLSNPEGVKYAQVFDGQTAKEQTALLVLKTVELMQEQHHAEIQQIKADYERRSAKINEEILNEVRDVKKAVNSLNDKKVAVLNSNQDQVMAIKSAQLVTLADTMLLHDLTPEVLSKTKLTQHQLDGAKKGTGPNYQLFLSEVLKGSSAKDAYEKYQLKK